jgi:hypothetical protein
MLHKITLCLLFVPLFSIPSADRDKRTKIRVMPGDVEIDTTVKEMKKYYVNSAKFKWHEGGINIIKKEKDLPPQQSLLHDPYIQWIIENLEKASKDISFAEDIVLMVTPDGPEKFCSDVIKMLKNGNLCEKENEILKRGREFVVLYAWSE